METRLARIPQDVETTHSDSAEVLYYLKNQPFSLIGKCTEEFTDSQSKQRKHTVQPDVVHISNAKVNKGGKINFVPSMTFWSENTMSIM